MHIKTKFDFGDSVTDKKGREGTVDQINISVSRVSEEAVTQILYKVNFPGTETESPHVRSCFESELE